MDDLISRQAAMTLPYLPKEYREYTTNNLDDAYEKGWDDCQECIKHIPADYTTWIPVSERLPENLQEVNVTWVNHNPESYYAFLKDKPFTATAVFYGGNWYWYTAQVIDYLGEYGECDTELIDRDIEITAWQPLPEPYKEEDA